MTVPQDISDYELVALARGALKRAYCPYSKFPVGAALLTETGEIISGCNVENASYGGTICAERSAVVSAVSQGYTKFRAIAVVTGLNEPAAPCGICRQFLVEFGNFKVVMGSLANGRVDIKTTMELLPNAFTPTSLEIFDMERQEGNTETVHATEKNSHTNIILT